MFLYVIYMNGRSGSVDRRSLNRPCSVTVVQRKLRVVSLVSAYTL